MIALQYSTELFDTKKHDFKTFTCGEEKLDCYLRERASQESRKKVAAVYIIHEKNSEKVIGYYTLSSFSIELVNLPEHITKKLPKYKALPTILLGRLAVDRTFQGKKIGKYMLLDALSRSYALSKQIGSFAVIVDAKDKESRNFYEKYGFMKTLKHPFTLYLPMGTIRLLIEEQ